MFGCDCCGWRGTSRPRGARPASNTVPRPARSRSRCLAVRHRLRQDVRRPSGCVDDGRRQRDWFAAPARSSSLPVRPARRGRRSRRRFQRRRRRYDARTQGTPDIDRRVQPQVRHPRPRASAKGTAIVSLPGFRRRRSTSAARAASARTRRRRRCGWTSPSPLRSGRGRDQEAGEQSDIAAEKVGTEANVGQRGAIAKQAGVARGREGRGR